MEKEIIDLLAPIALNLGTTVDQIYQTVLFQSKISAATTTAFAALTTYSTIKFISFVIDKTTKKGNTYPEWEEEGAFAAWAVVIGITLSNILYCIHATNNLLTAVLNPQYWALHKILSLIKN